MRRRLTPRVLALGGALLVLAVAALAVFVPYLSREREAVAGVPVPSPFAVEENIRLAPDQEVCLDAVAIDVDSEIAEFTVTSKSKSGPPLLVSAEAPDYRYAAEVDGGYLSPETIRVPLEPPTRSLLTEFCVANRGNRKVDLLGAHEPRTASRVIARVDGADIPQDLTLRFLSEEYGSVFGRLDTLVARMSAFHPLVLETPVLWLLLGLLVLVLPAAAIYAVVSSFRD
jgi:hypothetical protein